MTNRPNRLRLYGSLALACVVALSAHAAGVSASATKDYGRVHFNFSAPTKLKTSVNGSNAVLTFDQPLTDSPAAIKASLPGYITGATLSADKRSLTLTMNKPYRLRQFVTGNGVGVDLLPSPAGATPQQETTKAEAPAAATPEDISGPAAVEPTAPRETAQASEAPAKSIPTKKPAAVAKPLTKEASKLAVKETAAPQKPEKKPEPATAKATKAAPVETVQAHDAEVLSTTKPAVKTEEPPRVKPAEPAPSEPMLSTKKEDAPPTPVLSTKPTTKEAPVEARAESTTKPTSEPTPIPVAELEKTKPSAPAETPAAPTTETVPSKKKAEAPKAEEPKPEVEKGPFIVSAKTANGETTINFPWGKRTGVALFRRGQDIWVVFSQAKDVNIALLRTIMPKQVVNITQYAYPKNTVLRLVTDGSVFARAEQVKGRYGWNIILAATEPKPALDVPVVADAIDGTPRLVFGAFDVAPELRFYDPNAGDALIVVPSYENGRGVPVERNFPELSVLATPQGIAMVNRRSDVTLNSTRSGLILGAKDGLAISESLPLLPGSAPVLGASANTGIMLPYDQWYVPHEKYRETEMLRLQAIASASKASKADAMLELVKLYLSEGFGTEAVGVLGLIQNQFPQYYATNKLALMSAAAHVMDGHMAEAAIDMQAPELNDLEEAALWREVVALYAPPISTAQAIQQAAEQQQPTAGSDSAANTAPVPAAAPAPTVDGAAEATAVPSAKPVFHFLKYNKTFIRFYPPRLRQRLAQLAGDAYVADGQQEKAMAAYDTLVRDDLLEPVRYDAEFALGSAAEKKGEIDQAYEIYDRLAKQPENPRIAARARYAAAMLRYNKAKITGDEAAEILESTRTAWRGDAIEHDILTGLVDIYTASKRYDDVLRSYKSLIDGFPTDPELLRYSNEMSALFERVFLDGLAEEMQPLKALSLFYEFRDLTPLGEKGDKMIQKLADRLAAIDLLDRATQLLENQIKFRSTGEARSQIGARLALLYVLNHHPQEALNVLQVTNYGGNTPDLQTQRQQLTAEALTKLGKNEEALGVIANDTTKTGALLRLDILWALQDWPSVVNHAEDILNARANLTEPLSNSETEVLLKLALGYAFQSDNVQLRYLRDYYSGLIPDTGYKQIFDYITNDTTPLDPEDFVLLAQQISHTESFLDAFKSKIAAGKLSEAVK